MSQPLADRLSSSSLLITGMRVKGSPLPSQKKPDSLILGFVRVDGQYRLGKLLRSGASGESHFNHVHLIFLNSLGRVFQGKDIRTSFDVAVKIGHARSLSLKLKYEYNVYTAIAGGTGVPKVLWYGKEGEHKVIVLEFLGTSLGDLIKKRQLDSRRTFLYATQMVCW